MNHLLVALLLFFSCTQSIGQYVLLDETFSNQGLLDYKVDNYPSFGSSVAIDEEGRLIVAGYISGLNVPNNNTGFIIRYSSSGVIDDSFGENGIVKIQIDGQSIISDIKIHKSYILFSGLIYHSTGNTAELYIGKLTSNGTLDDAFGNHGIVKSGLSSHILSCGQTSIHVDESDEITTGWYNKEKIIYVNRYQWNGAPSLDFNNTGGIIHNNYVCAVYPKPTYAQNESKALLLAGAKMVDPVNYTSETFISLYTAEGNFIREQNLGSLGVPMVLKSDMEGNWYLALTNFSDYNSYVYVYRLKPDGTIDSSFGQEGKASIDISKNVFSISEMVIKNDRIFLCGQATNDTDVFLCAISTDGVRDENFGDHGVILKQIKAKNGAVQLALSDDEKNMYLCGYSYNSIDQSSFIVLKYTLDRITTANKLPDTRPLVIYPNPCDDALHLSFKNSEERTIKIINNKGLVLYQETTSQMNETVPLNHFLAGIYILIVESETGHSTKQVFLKK